MSGIQYQSVTNRELAKYLDNTGVKNLSQAELEHTALRFIEIFRNGEFNENTALKVTRVPYVVS